MIFLVFCYTFNFSSHTNEFLRDCVTAQECESARGRSKLNDRERRQAALPILIFGNDLVNSNIE